MLQRLRLVILVIALAVAVPALQPTNAHAADVPAGTDFRVPKVLTDWVKKNLPTLYIVFDEIMDDLTGCDCPPPTSPAPPPPPPIRPPY